MIKNSNIVIDKSNLNLDILEQIKYFLNKVNERALFQMGILDSYDDEGDAALGLSVEYFHPAIILDDRMRYIMENIVTSGISQDNIICNTIISHFYGARGIHQIITRNNNPKEAFVDFERLLVDEDYVEECLKNLTEAKELGIPLYGSTELRTSIFGSANSYVAKKYNRERDSSPINILLWVAGFIERGITKQMLNASSLEEMYKVITQLEGIGGYYGYHCSTSNSVNPEIKINHDERFCIPGPGARKTLDMLFQEGCKIPYGDRVIWFRENYVDLIGDIELHPSTHNVVVDGKKVLPYEQDTLKTYGCEVALCQFGVYTRLRDNPHLINRRKVARLDEEISKKFFSSGKVGEIFTYIKFSELINGEKQPIEIIEADCNIVDTPKIKESTQKQSKENKINIVKEKSKVKKEKGVQYIPTSDQLDTVKSIIDDLEDNKFTHGKIANMIPEDKKKYFNQDTNWKDSWKTLQYLVFKGFIIKEGRSYLK